MLLRKIRDIRRKPKAIRDQYALWTAVVFTGLVILVWLGTLPARLSFTAAEIAEAPTDSPVESFGAVVSDFREEITRLQATSSVDATGSATTTATTQETDVVPVTTQPITTPVEVRIATVTASTTN